ncbi:MAG: hypothetical protein OQJ84_02135, partial [Xanthomonadales bacterium]|nr:hypothetical protein [Xanthomonadales bacterium]
AQCLAQSVENGSYVVVRGAVEGCEAWSFRILDIAKAEDNEPVTLLNIPGITVIDLTSEQIRSNLIAAIQDLTGNEPKSISVEILDSEQKYNFIVKEYWASLNALLEGVCPFENKANRAPPLDGEYWEEKIQEIKKQDIARSVT